MTVPSPPQPRTTTRRSAAQRPLSAAERVPLHFEVFTALRDAIFRGDYPQGSQLPGELALGDRFKVSRITVRRALDELAARGLVRRVQGKGTTVCPRPAFSPVIADVNGLLERNVVIGLETTSELEEFAYVPAPADVAEALRLDSGARVQMAVRLRFRDGSPFAHVTSWIPERIGRRFDAEDLLHTPVLALLERHGIAIDYVELSIAAAGATRNVARALRVEPGTPLLKVQRTVFATDGAAVERSQVFYPAERHQYRITLRRGSGNPAARAHPAPAKGGDGKRRKGR
jgi:GntR family transcriptional regulator